MWFSPRTEWLGPVPVPWSTGEGIGYPLQYSRASLVTQLVKNQPAMWGPGFNPWVGNIPWRRETVSTPVFWPGESHGLSPWGRKESDTTERLSVSLFPVAPFDSPVGYLILWLIPIAFSLCLHIVTGEGNGNPLQYSCLENPMDGGAWKAAVHGVLKSRTRLSYFTFTFHFHALEKEMATHSSVLAWGIPGTGEPGGLPTMGSHRVGHDWSDLAAAAAAHSYSCYLILSYTHLLYWACSSLERER